MQKPIALAASAALLLTSCQTKSPTWKTVTAASRAAGDAEARDRAYAAELHHRLRAVPHKVVTYKFDRASSLNGTEKVERTGVVYFDECNRKQPWWIMTDSLSKPVWLPNEPLEHQIAFFARGPAQVVELHDYTTSRDKIVQPVERVNRPVGTSTLQRVAKTEPAHVVPPQKTNATPATSVKDHHRRSGWWIFGSKPETKKEPAVSHLEPVPASRPSDATPTSKVQTPKVSAAKAPATKAPAATAKPNPKAVPAAEVKKAGTTLPGNKPLTEKDGATSQPQSKSQESPAADRVEKKESAPSEKPNAQPKAAVPAQPRKKPSLFNREDKPADSTTPPPPPGGAAADRPRKNLFQRILSSLNPTFWFHRAA